MAALTGSGALIRVSADAYAACSPSSGVWLTRSRFRDLAMRPGRAAFAVRWETSSPDGEPFPVLDADLTLIPAGPSAALLQLAGVYQAGFGQDDRRTAALVLGGFLNRIVETVTRADAASG